MMLARQHHRIVKLTNSRFFSTMSRFRDEENDVLLETKNSTQFITLNRPDQLNALNLSQIRKLTPNYRKHILAEPQTVKTFVLKGSIEKAFCAGGDIKAIASTKDTQFFKEEYELNYLIGTMKKPHVAIINGITMGGGVGLSVHGSIRVATETTMFAMPETAIGFFTDVGGSYFLSRLPKHLGMYLGLTGNRLKGKQVLAAGIATHFVPKADLPALEQLIVDADTEDPEQLSKLISERFPVENATIKEQFPDIDKIEKVFKNETVDGIVKALEQINDEWSQGILKTLRSVSPTSLRVVNRQINLGKHLSFKECFLMEEGIAHQMMQQNDFFEGVRALLVDKDKNPKWNPATLEQVTREQIDAYFKVVQDRVDKHIPQDENA